MDTLPSSGQLRFALYARTSTEDQQSPEQSLGWQRARAEGLIAGVGGIVVTFHDVGQSRSLPWKRRPEATTLLAEVAQLKTRRFDAIVIAEPARAFSGNEFGNVFPILFHHEVELWVPEVGGKVDPGSEAHDLVMLLFGGMSKGERNRIKMRTKFAMREQGGNGRWLGGRPPYGLMTVDSETPHPKDAARFLQRLVPDPVTAPVVKRIFADYLAGKGITVITNELTLEGITSPSHYDLKRNRHREDTAGAWGKCGVRSILQNPTYMGKRVFGRQRKAEVLVDPTDASLGYRSTMKNNDPSDWVYPAEDTHEALVTPDEFAAVQARFASRRGGRGPKSPRKDRRVYPLQGLVVCATCGRRLFHTTIPKGGKEYAYATCRLSTAEYARNPELEATHPKTSYLRADKVVTAVNGWLAQIADDDHIDDTAKLLAAAEQDRHQAMTGGVDRDAEAHRARARLMEADGKIKQRIAALDAGADPAVMAQSINDAQNDKRAAEADLARLAPDRPPTADEVKTLLVQLRGVLNRLNQADPAVLNAAYRELGLRAVWQPRSPVVQVSISPELPGQSKDQGVRDSDGGGGGI